MFNVITFSPLHLDNTSLAIETVRAGGLALFDLDFLTKAEIEKAVHNLNRTLVAIPKQSKIGLKLNATQLVDFKPIITKLSKESIVLISDLDTEVEKNFEIPKWIKKLNLEIWGELNSISHESVLNNSNFHSFVLKGNESGGTIGDESSFILASHLIKKSNKPCYIRGGIGIHTAAACFASGASGVVLDDHLLAFKTSPFPFEWKSMLKNLGLENTKTILENNKKIRVVNHPLFKDATRIGWGDPSEFRWPVGQMAGMAEAIASKYKTVGRYIQAIHTNVKYNIQAAQANQPLGIHSKMAKSNGTQFPIVQGPMTRVSDVPEFIESVANAGGLPFLALSMTAGKDVSNVLESTKLKLIDKPWGVGVLGFVEEKLRIHQFSEIKKIKPPFALISGGTVSQIHEFEQEGIKTFVHVPTPGLLKMYLEQGCNRFIFEGRECGGHVGPIGSFSLWQSVIDVLLELPTQRAETVQILFAGGIYKDLSTCMISAMSGQLVDHGVEIGVLMGTAYLFTNEVCDSGAILPKFQKTAINCTKTAVIEVSPGHAIRCAETPFVEEFNREKKKGNQDLEKLTLGRLRIASKGLQRDATGNIIQVSEKEQFESGMYMLGEVAGLVSKLTNMQELHRHICENGNKLLQEIQIEEKSIKENRASNIAIVGISTLLPKANSAQKFWSNIINKVDAITQIPSERWDWKVYYDEDKSKKDKIYSKWGGFIDDIVFDPLKYGIPPHSLKSISPGQLLLLEAVDRALQDAGYENGGFDRENTSVIVGSDGMSTLKTQYTVRSISPLAIDLLTNEDLDRLPDWNEESFPGILTNLLAGRIANRFNLGGSNFTVDSACASSLTAVDIAVKELEHGNSNMVIAAGVDIAQSPFSYTAFSKTQALSPTGTSKPFSKSANGIVISEGVAVVLLKRLEDAERDGDKIYGVIKGAANSSDGKGLGITAPRSGGQEKAIFRAYKKAGYSPSTIGVYEAHGTGTSVGDKVELTTINTVLEKSHAQENSCAVGSVKSLIGHTKTAAGIVGLIKSTLSLYYKTLAPHPMDKNPLDLISEKNSSVYLLDKARPWYKKKGLPRRAGVSAFGFGGTNTHVTIEEYENPLRSNVFGNENWPAELFLFTSDSKEELLKNLRLWENSLTNEISVSLKDLAYIAYSETRGRNCTIKLSITAISIDNLQESIKRVIKKLTEDDKVLLPPQISLNLKSEENNGKIGFVFPGQGSQYVNMSLENSLYIKEIREAIQFADTELKRETELSKIIFPEATFSEETSNFNQQRLQATQNAQPAIGAISLGYLNFLKALGIEPESVAGHSYGEFTALYSSGVLSLKDFIRLSAIRGAIMASGCEIEGSMAVVSAKEKEISKYLNSSVFVANLNAPKQIVLSGEKKALLEVIKKLKENGFKAKEIPVAGPFHTPFFKAAQNELEKKIRELKIESPKIPLYSNTSGELYPKDEQEIQDLLNKHLLSPVHFSKEVEQMYQDGVRLFIEVGPNKVLTGLINTILESKPIQAVALEGQGGGIKGLLSAAGVIYTNGFHINLAAIFKERNCNYLSLAEALKSSEATTLSKASVLLHGGGVRGFDEHIAKSGKLDLIDSSNRKEISSRNDHSLFNHATSLNKNEKLLKGYQAYQETMKQFLASQESMMARFLNDEFITEDHQQIQIPTTVNTNNQPKTEDKIEEPKIDASQQVEIEKDDTENKNQSEQKISKESLLEKMIGIISERTGYPTDMLNKDIDLEAELGIDSIKRMEILDKVLRELPEKHEAALKPEMSKLMKTKTIEEFLKIVFDKAIIEPLYQNLEDEDLKDSSSSVDTETLGKTCSRYVMKSVFHELPYNRETKLEGVHLITSDNENIADLVAQKIEEHGGVSEIITEEFLASPELLNNKISEIFNKYSEISSLIHCAPLSKIEMPEELKDWKNTTQIQSKSLFQILRLAAMKQEKEVNYPIQKVLTVSSFGGYFGRKQNESHGLPSSGGNSGMLKALKKEKPDLEIQIIDFDDFLLESEIAYRIIRELEFTSEFIEVGYPRGERVIFHPVAADITNEDSEKSSLLDKDSVVLATGGAKGITAEISKSMMIPGMKLIIVGRSEKIDMEAIPEGGTNKSFDQLIDIGVEIKYYSVDLRDSEAFKNLIDEVYRTYGRIDAVIHGAGIIEDEYIDQKQLESFDTVFDTKVDTAFLLYKYLRPESLKLLVFFGSVSGRFGNQGQTDYATANEVLNRFAWFLHQKWPKTKTITINWGPWNTIGMASPMVIRLLESQGMHTINPEEGCNFFLREIYQDHNETSEVIAGEGPWANLEEIVVPELEFEHIFNQTQIPSIF